MSYGSAGFARHLYERVMFLLDASLPETPPHPKRAWTLGTASHKYLLALQKLKAKDCTEQAEDWFENQKRVITETYGQWCKIVSNHSDYSPQWSVSLAAFQQLIDITIDQPVSLDQASSVFRELRNLIQLPEHGFEFIPIGWVDWVADRISDADAAWLYELGLRNNPTWRTAIVKWAGSALTAGEAGNESLARWQDYLDADKRGIPAMINQICQLNVTRRPLIENLRPQSLLFQVPENAATSQTVRARLKRGAIFMRERYEKKDNNPCHDVFYSGMADVILHALEGVPDSSGD